MINDAGVSVNLPNKAQYWQRTALHCAAENGVNEIVQILLENGANLNCQDKYGCTPLVLAALNGKTDTVDMLLKAGARTNCQTQHGNSEFHFAASHGNKETLALLLRNNRFIFNHAPWSLAVHILRPQRFNVTIKLIIYYHHYYIWNCRG